MWRLTLFAMIWLQQAEDEVSRQMERSMQAIQELQRVEEAKAKVFKSLETSIRTFIPLTMNSHSMIPLGPAREEND